MCRRRHAAQFGAGRVTLVDLCRCCHATPLSTTQSCAWTAPSDRRLIPNSHTTAQGTQPHRAINLAGTPPAVVKPPAAQRASPPPPPSSNTLGASALVPAAPDPAANRQKKTRRMRNRCPPRCGSMNCEVRFGHRGRGCGVWFGHPGRGCGVRFVHPGRGCGTGEDPCASDSVIFLAA